MTRRSVRRMVAILVFTLLGSSGIGSAYPIAPRTMWDLAREAELIVLARVEAVTHRAEADSIFETSVARLQVLETWKGPATATLEVLFTEGLICPAPDRYIERETVLAFLASGEARLRRLEDADRQAATERWSGRWFTIALSYGTLYPDPVEVPVFRQLVAEALELQARDPVPEADRRDWLVRAAAYPATRWHGLYDLARDADPIHSFYDSRKDPPQLAATLTEEERAVLADAFCEAPLLDHTVPMMLQVLAGHPSREVDLTGLAAVETALAAEDVPFWVHQAMPLVLARFGEAPKALKREKKGKGNCDPGADPLIQSMQRTDAQTRRAWAKARKRLHLPPVALLTQPPRRDRGVGGYTPP